MGVSILPRLAAMVCMHTTGMVSARRVSGARPLSTTKVKGTKVSRETSLVMIMLPKKHSPTRTSTSCMESTASTAATERTVSCLRNRFNFI